MASSLELPEGYREFFQLDLQKDKKTALVVNILALVIAAAMIGLASSYLPITTLFHFQDGGSYFLRIVLLVAGFFVYLILHELVHGIFMRKFSQAPVQYGFTGLYAYAGSKAYFNKKQYLTIALAPVVIWGAVLLVLNCFSGSFWFWVVYLIQVFNISGAAGDFYVTFRFSRFPQDILIQDSGVAMRVFSRENREAT